MSSLSNDENRHTCKREHGILLQEINRGGAHTTVQRYDEQKGLTFNFESRSKQKSLGDGGGSGATNCGENRR